MNWLTRWVGFSLPAVAVLSVSGAQTNLLTDGSFEGISQGELSANWYVETNTVYHGSQAIRYTATAAPSGWSPAGVIQSFPVEEGHVYAANVSALNVDLAGPGVYKSFLVLKYYDDQGAHIWIGSAGGHTWNRSGGGIFIPHINYVTAPAGAVEARLEPMLYQCTGTIIIDDVSICALGAAPAPAQLDIDGTILLRVPTPEIHPQPAFTPAQQTHGYVVFVRDEPGFVFPGSYPQPEEIADGLTARAAMGVDAAFPFAVYPLRDMRQVEIAVSDFAGPEGATIARDRAALARVRSWPQRVSLSGGNRFAVIPELLEPMDRQEEVDRSRFSPPPTEYDWASMQWTGVTETVFGAQDAQLLWLLVDVPGDALPGFYNGELILSALDCETTTLPLTLRVLPFELGAPDGPSVGFYLYDHRYDEYSDAALAEEFRRMKAAGIEVPVLALENRYGHNDGFHFVTGEVEGSTRIVAMQSPRLERILAAFNAAGMRGPLVVGYHPLLNRAVAAALGLPPEEGCDMCDWSEAVREGMVDALQATTVVMADYGQGANWAMALKDEPGEDYADHITAEAELAREAGVLTYVTASPFRLPSGVVSNLDFVCNPRVYDGASNADRLQWCATNDVQYWYYEGGAYTSQDGKVFPNRFFSGFQLLKSGAACHVGYTFQSGLPDPWNEFAHSWGISWNTTYPLLPAVGWTNGPFLSTLQWEGVKAARTDLRSVATLDAYVLEAEAGAGPGLQQAAASAGELRGDILDALPWGLVTHYGYPAGPLSPADLPDVGFHNGQAQAFREQLEDAITRLQRALSADEVLLVEGWDGGTAGNSITAPPYAWMPDGGDDASVSRTTVFGPSLAFDGDTANTSGNVNFFRGVPSISTGESWHVLSCQAYVQSASAPETAGTGAGRASVGFRNAANGEYIVMYWQGAEGATTPNEWRFSHSIGGGWVQSAFPAGVGADRIVGLSVRLDAPAGAAHGTLVHPGGSQTLSFDVDPGVLMGMDQVMLFSDPLNGSWPPRGALQVDNLMVTRGRPEPLITQIAVAEAAEIAFDSAPGTRYRLQCSTNPAASGWQDTDTIVVGDGGPRTVLDGAGFHLQKLYRLLVLP